MGRYTRRDLLVTAGFVLAGSIAGCSTEEDPEPGLHAVSTLVLHRAGDPWYDYPADVGVRVTVENTAADRHTGVLEITLRRTDGEGEWTRERDVNLSGGTTIAHEVPFEDVADSPTEEFEATSVIRPTDG